MQGDAITKDSLVTGQGSDPVMGISWSDDGGHDFDNEELVPIGGIGDFDARARLTRLGRARNRVFKCRISDPVKVFIISAIVKIGGENG